MPRRKSLRLGGLSLLPPTSAPATSDVAPTQVGRGLDVQQILLIKEEMPWSPCQDQQDPDLLNIKEEQEELLTNQEGKKPNGLEEADNTRFPITARPVKSEDDDEKPQFSHTHQCPAEDGRAAEPPTSSSGKRIKAETDGEDCGGAEPTTTPNPNNHLQPNIDVKISASYETVVNINDKWQEPLSEPEPETEDSEKSGVNSDVGCNTTKKPFICSECGKQFLHDWSLQRHMRLQSGKKPSSCLVNNKCSRVKQNVDSQETVHTEEKPFGCDVCGQRFKLNVNLKAHMKVHTGEKPFSCSICEKKFRHQCNLKTHMRLHTGEKPFGCGMCDKRFTQSMHLKTHMRIHTGEKPFGCDDCGKRFSRLRILRSHMRVHTGEKPFDCDVCHKKFSQLGDLTRHKRVHTGEKPFSCSVCGKKFTQRMHFKTHVRIHTGERPFSCDVCGKSFNCKRNLKTHMRVHTGEKPFGCDVCGKRFSQQGILKRHTSIHTRIKRLVLDQSTGTAPSELVPTDFRNRRDVHQMLQIEEGVSSSPSLDKKDQSGVNCDVGYNTAKQSFSCSECDKTFFYKRSLQRHRKCHSVERSSSGLLNKKCSKVNQNVVDTDKKMFGCDICGQRFNQNSHLKIHMRIHTGEKPFSCKICGKMFRRQYSLDRHIRVHTGEKPFACGVCGKRFSNLWDLKRHRSVHTKSPRPDEPKDLGLVPPIPSSATSELVQTQVKTGADVQQMLPIKEEVPWSPSLDQQDSQPLHIKEEQEGLFTRQEGEQISGLDEAKIPRFPSTGAAVKSEDDEEKPESSQLHQRPGEDNREAEYLTSSSAKQIKADTDEEDCGGPEPATNLDPNSHLQANANANGKASDSHETEVSADNEGHEPLSSFGPETEDSNKGWKESRAYKPEVNSDVGCNTAKKPFSCSECGKQFFYKQSLQRHWKCHSGKEASSWLVNKCFKVKQNVDSQMTAHTEEKTFGCDVCGQTFTRSTNLKIHVRVHTGEKPFSCNICEKTFGHHCNLKTHMRIHTGEKPFGCSLCDKKFTQRIHLKTHMSVHTGARPFVCDVCNKGFSQMRILKSHMSIHTEDRPFGCDVCPKRFAKLGDLKRHESVHAGEKPFKCTVCEKQFTQRIHFKTHMSIHTGERPFCCEICGKRFKCNRNLKLHMSVHTGEKPFVCDICGKRLKCDKSLKIHMTSHTGEKPFGCGVCGKKFSQSGILKRHMRIHTGVTPFGCNVCGKKFRCKGNLNSHMRVHSGEKPFVCDVCGKGLKSNSNLKNHLRLHSGERPFGCDICYVRFNEEGSLKRHMKCRHVTVVKDL